jgi:hypothetical protein
MNIYLDMDDVVADWMGYARAYLKVEWKEGEMVPDNQWRRLKDDQRMYSKLPLKEGAHELVDWCKRYSEKTGCGLYFLTAICPGHSKIKYFGHKNTFRVFLYSSDLTATKSGYVVKVQMIFLSMTGAVTTMNGKDKEAEPSCIKTGQSVNCG